MPPFYIMQLPRLLRTDAIARYYGLEKGQVVKVTYDGDMTRSHVTYRCVWWCPMNATWLVLSWTSMFQNFLYLLGFQRRFYDYGLVQEICIHNYCRRVQGTRNSLPPLFLNILKYASCVWKKRTEASCRRCIYILFIPSCVRDKTNS